MKKISLLIVALLCVSGTILAGEVITNDTGEDATGLRVVLSTPVLITGYGDILTSVDPQILSYEFVFSGGTVKPWDSHWFNYVPATASVMKTEWLAEPPARSWDEATGVNANMAIKSDPPPSSLTPHLGNLQYVNMLGWWDVFLDKLSDQNILQTLWSIETAGYGGISLDYWLFVDDLTLFDVHKHHYEGKYGTLRSPTDSELQRMLDLIEGQTHLDVNIRFCLYVNPSLKDDEGGHIYSFDICPRNPELLLANMATQICEVARIASEYGVEMMTVLTEMSCIEQYDGKIHQFLELLDPHFDGWFAINQATHHYLRKYEHDRNVYQLRDMLGTLWGWSDSDRRPLIIQINVIDSDFRSSTQSSMINEFVSEYAIPVAYFHDQYPEHYVMIGELAFSQDLGQACMADSISAVIIGARELGLTGFSLDYYSFFPNPTWHYVVPKAVRDVVESELEAEEGS